MLFYNKSTRKIPKRNSKNIKFDAQDSFLDYGIIISHQEVLKPQHRPG